MKCKYHLQLNAAQPVVRKFVKLDDVVHWVEVVAEINADIYFYRLQPFLGWELRWHVQC